MASNERYGAFLLYVDDWLSSTAIDLMNAAEERGYFRLLMHAWKSDDCGLPDDDAVLARLSKLGRAWSKSAKSGAVLRAQFFSRDGRLYNERLMREREHQQKVRASRSQAGKTAAEHRWHASRIADVCVSDANSKLETQTIKESNRIEVSHVLSSMENTERVKREIGAHRNRGDEPDERIVGKIVAHFDREESLSAWLNDIRANLDPSGITGNGYAFYEADARRFVENGCKRPARRTVPKIKGPKPWVCDWDEPLKSTMDPETRRRLDERRSAGTMESTMDPELRRELDERRRGERKTIPPPYLDPKTITG